MEAMSKIDISDSKEIQILTGVIGSPPLNLAATREREKNRAREVIKKE